MNCKDRVQFEAYTSERSCFPHARIDRSYKYINNIQILSEAWSRKTAARVLGFRSKHLSLIGLPARIMSYLSIGLHSGNSKTNCLQITKDQNLEKNVSDKKSHIKCIYKK